MRIDWQDLGAMDVAARWRLGFGSAERNVTARLIKFSPAKRLALDFTRSRAPELLEADTN